MPPALARRIDRLSRRAHGFHRYAHHPLCAAYAGEVVRLGPRIRLCRGCLLAGLGALAGAVAGFSLAPLAAPVLTGLVILLGLGAVALGGYPRPFGGRGGKAATRFLPLALASFVVLQGARAGGAGWLKAAAVLALILVAHHRYRQRGPHRGPCATCPERQGPALCSGLRPIARRERAFQRLANRWL